MGAFICVVVLVTTIVLAVIFIPTPKGVSHNEPPAVHQDKHQENYSLEELDEEFSAAVPAVEVKKLILDTLEQHAKSSANGASIEVSAYGIVIERGWDWDNIFYTYKSHGYKDIKMPKLCLYTEWIARTIKNEYSSWRITGSRTVSYPVRARFTVNAREVEKGVSDNNKINILRASDDEHCSFSPPYQFKKESGYVQWDVQPASDSDISYTICVDYKKPEPQKPSLKSW